MFWYCMLQTCRASEHTYRLSSLSVVSHILFSSSLPTHKPFRVSLRSQLHGPWGISISFVHLVTDTLYAVQPAATSPVLHLLYLTPEKYWCNGGWGTAWELSNYLYSLFDAKCLFWPFWQPITAVCLLSFWLCGKVKYNSSVPAAVRLNILFLLSCTRVGNVLGDGGDESSQHKYPMCHTYGTVAQTDKAVMREIGRILKVPLPTQCFPCDYFQIALRHSQTQVL